MAGSIHAFGWTEMVDAAVMNHQSVAEDRWSRWRERLVRGKPAGNLAFWAAAAVLLIFTAMAVWPEALAPYNPRLGRLADRLSHPAMSMPPEASTGWGQITRAASTQLCETIPDRWLDVGRDLSAIVRLGRQFRRVWHLASRGLRSRLLVRGSWGLSTSSLRRFLLRR